MNTNDFGTQLPTLIGDGLKLRWLTEADLPALSSIFTVEVARYMACEPLTEPGSAETYLQSIVDGFVTGELYQWGIERQGRIIGTCTLAGIDRGNRCAEIGFALAQELWGRGLIQCAVPAVIDFAFERLDLHRIGADVDPRNIASIRTLEKLGFQREGLLRECCIHLGEIQDAMLFGLLRREWRARRG